MPGRSRGARGRGPRGGAKPDVSTSPECTLKLLALLVESRELEGLAVGDVGGLRSQPSHSVRRPPSTALVGHDGRWPLLASGHRWCHARVGRATGARRHHNAATLMGQRSSFHWVGTVERWPEHVGRFDLQELLAACTSARRPTRRRRAAAAGCHACALKIRSTAPGARRQAASDSAHTELPSGGQMCSNRSISAARAASKSAGASPIIHAVVSGRPVSSAACLTSAGFGFRHEQPSRST